MELFAARFYTIKIGLPTEATDTILFVGTCNSFSVKRSRSSKFSHGGQQYVNLGDTKHTGRFL